MSSMSDRRVEKTFGPYAIVSAGQVVITHGMGGAPKNFEIVLKCLTAEAGYAVGETAVYALGMRDQSGSTAYRGVSVVPTATTITMRYGSSATVFDIIDATTGDGVGLANANWEMYVRATR